LDDTYWLAQTYLAQGVTASFQGDIATACTLHEASLSRFKELGDQLGIMSALNELGEVVLLQGDHETARSLQCASLEIARRIEDHERIAMALAALAQLAAAQKQPARALRLAATATALDDETGRRSAPAWQGLLNQWLEPARRALGTEASEAAWLSGLTMPLHEAIEYALSADRPAASAPVPRVTETTTSLTQRELDVAALVARGLSNRQIAARLVIAEGTATNHVKHILTKLALDSRVQIAAWAIGLGLHLPAGS
jgi:non-specific serine/threonine protein kinase